VVNRNKQTGGWVGGGRWTDAKKTDCNRRWAWPKTCQRQYDKRHDNTHSVHRQTRNRIRAATKIIYANCRQFICTM